MQKRIRTFQLSENHGEHLMWDSNHKALARGPDFLCIGMQKAGTGFIYECLQNMDGFRMPLRKEIHHFDKHGQVHPRGVQLLERLARRARLEAGSAEIMHRSFQQLKARRFWPKKIRLEGRNIVLDPLNVEFLKKFSHYVSSGAGDQEYLDLFSPYQAYLTGDVTPAYSTLETDAVRKVHDLLPATKIILCVREPVSRLWSQLNMRARREFKARHNRPPKQTDMDEFNKLLAEARLSKLVHGDNFMKRSRATRVYEKWIDVYGEENLLVINFEDLISKTDTVLDKTADFLGAKSQQSKTIPTNKKEDALKIRIDDSRRELLESVLADELVNYVSIFQQHRDRI